LKKNRISKQYELLQSTGTVEMKIKPIREKWKGTKTDRERFNNQMNYKSFDRCFNMEFGFWEENFQEWPLFTDTNVKTNEEADLFFNFDPIKVFYVNTWINPPFEDKVVEETETTKIIINIDGLYEELPKDDHSTIPRYLKSSVENPDDWKQLKAERLVVNDPRRKVDIKYFKEKFPENRDYPLGIHTGSMIGKIRDTLTFEGLTYATYDYPDMVEDMVETACLIVEDMLDQVLPHFKFDYAAGWEDIAFKNGPLISVDFFKNVIVPRYKRIHKKLNSAGINLWYVDCDGDVRPLLPHFLDVGVNCMFPHEVNGSGHPAELFDKYGKDLRIMGGFDKMEMRKGKAAIKTYMENLVPLVERGGFIPFCDHRCPPDVAPDDYIYYLDLKEKMFGM